MSKAKTEKKEVSTEAIKKQILKLGSKALTQKEKETYKLIAIDEFVNLQESKEKLGFSSTVILRVTKKFFDQYMKTKMPASHMANQSNAYVYGKLYKKDMIYVGSHYNDIANTGAYDVTEGIKFDGSKIHEFSMDFFKKSKTWNWFDKDFLKIVKTFYPEVLFLGETVGGDVGAAVYVHLDKDNEIDSIMIDNDYFHKPTEH